MSFLSGLTSGLATYELIKIGASIVILTCILSSLCAILISDLGKNYLTTPGNIVNSTDGSFSQTLTYTVNGKVYTKNYSGSTSNGTLNYANTPGPCTVYYVENNPDDYSLSASPKTMLSIITSVITIIIIGLIVWFYFLKTHKEVAQVVGTVDAAHDLFSLFKSK